MSLVIKLALLLIRLILILFSLDNLSVKLLDSLNLGMDSALRSKFLFVQLALVGLVGLQLLILLLFALDELFPLLVSLLELSLLLKLLSLIVSAFHIGDLLSECLNFLHLFLFVDLAICRLRLLFIDALLQIRDLVHFLHRHADRASHILRLLPDLTDLGFALLERLLLLVEGALQHVILRLILLLERAQVLVAHNLVEEGLELPLDLVKDIWVEAQLINLLDLLGSVSDGANIELD